MSQTNLPFSAVNASDLSEMMNWRYAVKAHDPDKRIPEDKIEAMKSVLRLAPSSVNVQPWHFVIAKTDEGKDRIAKAGTDESHSFNSDKVRNCSHLIVMAGLLDVEDEYLTHLLDVEEEAGRFGDQVEKRRGEMKDIRAQTISMHRAQRKDLQPWLDRQTYINLGTILLAAAALGIDAGPMEGFDADSLDAELGLRNKGYKTLALISLGYRGEDDYNADLPKARLPQSEILTEL